MLPDLPYEIALLIFDLSLSNDDVGTAKALREVNRECALRFARPVWFVGARNHYLNYLLRLPCYQRRLTMRWLFDGHRFVDSRQTIRQAATAAAEATSAAMQDDHKLFPALSKCTKFRH
jgi:hypothetical protein